MIKIVNPESIIIEVESLPALQDVCSLAYTYAANHGIAGMTEEKRKRALDFAKTILNFGIVIKDDEN